MKQKRFQNWKRRGFEWCARDDQNRMVAGRNWHSGGGGSGGGSGDEKKNLKL